MFGEVEVVSSVDLGPLGPKQGMPVRCNVPLVGAVTPMLAWLIILGLLVLPRANRTARAWWVWLPLLVVAAIAKGVTALPTMDNPETVVVFGEVPLSLAIGLAALWLLWPGVIGRSRWTTFFLGLLVLELASFGAFALRHDWQHSGMPGRAFWGLLLAMCAFCVLAATNLAGRLCRDAYSWRKFTRWVLVWLMAEALIFSAGTVILVLARGEVPPMAWFAIPLVSGMCGLILFGILLGFLILSAVHPFDRQRLEALAAIGRAACAPPSPTPPEPRADAPASGGG
jgi:hypothetical protein